MDPKRLKRILATVAGALGGAVLLFTVLTFINAEDGFANCTGTSALGWTVPLLSAVLIGGVALVLLRRGPNHLDDDPPPDTFPCSACGRNVMRDWKLCPYCGASKNDAANGDASRFSPD
jgi:hypothetical protein